ncbi:UDP-glucuronosyltransferase [Orussus abietinus]|uniref:UDP-glucuronosyltransferase n=1 Tax=Orussus abietinus TaxID=222816 RepID=UPI0006259870|nr:UDP-glucuronosyltransferase [Orussus abietinus]XP_012287226.1 UDP-glucuronosyltransferase [Orussus abietinus]XP_023288142.1 UDP-glucuronosyltransferase [Orussus abietinus]XP_023288143.1 UDP-glucuronosyltransferase [Orussus abietinus]
MKRVLIVFVWFAIRKNWETDGARILGIFPTAAYSHQRVFHALMLALNKRGHEIVMLTTHPVGDPTLRNFTEIDLGFAREHLPDVNYIEWRRTSSWVDIVPKVFDGMGSAVVSIFEDPNVRKLYESEVQRFDVVFVEVFCWHAMYSFAWRFNAPLIGVTSLGESSLNRYSIGEPVMTSHPSMWELQRRSGINLPFWKRVVNFVEVWRLIYDIRANYMGELDRLARKYLGHDMPYIGDIEKNMSLLMVNQQLPISEAALIAPKVVYIGGIQVELKKPPPLPEDLQKFLDDANEGFIYASLGSTVTNNMLPMETKELFYEVFSGLPWRVLWKASENSFLEKKGNVRIVEWVSQKKVLAHPNIKLFIYQGGLQSTEEAINNSVPLLGMPILADQDWQVSKLVSLGVARCLEIIDLKRSEFEEAIRDLIINPRYKKRMVELHSLIADKPSESWETAVWWTEYVIRHKGDMSHLHSTTADEPWHQRFDRDIIAFFASIATLAAILISFIVINISRRIFLAATSARSSKKSKTN